MPNRELLRSAFESSLPVMFGYLPLGSAYGILFSELGYPWIYCTLSSFLIFAGAGQFLSVGMLSAGMGFAEVFLATFLINFRHIFFGFSFLGRFEGTGLKKVYMIHMITDETYSLLTATPPKKDALEDQEFCLVLGMLNHSYWILGSTLGAVLGGAFEFDTAGFGFTLTALFIVLTIEQAKAVRRAFPFVIGIVAGVFSLLIWSGQFLMLSLSLSVVALLIYRQTQGEVQVGS